jgi:putative membrane protein
VSRERFVVMERRLFGIMTIGMVLAVAFGAAMVFTQPGYLSLGWLRVKLVLVAPLVFHHFWCRRLMRDLERGERVRSQRWYRWFNEVPGILLIAIVILAVVKPPL